MLSRRQFLQRLAITSLLTSGAGAAYALREAKSLVVERIELAPRHLPSAFDGCTFAFLADTHHGPFVPLSYLREAVEITNDLKPDFVVLGGDYVQRRRPFFPTHDPRPLIAPGVGVFGELRAPLGRFAVLGNHDRKVSAMLTRRALADNGFVELTNTGVWLERGSSRLRLCGVDDYRTGKPDLRRALGDCRPGDACLLFSHNPDIAERIRDPRVDLIFSGHTHGGQVVLPIFGAPFTASRYGQKYRAGLVQAPTARVYVSRGVGTIAFPFRWGAPPEVTFVTIRSALPYK